ncbi:MAG: mechanosensitive ion channel [Bacteroidales bacterium]|nr:mechanosensitive ion channel [Bacteroidales bacterium]
MKKQKFFSILVALFALAVPAMAVFTGMDLDATLSNLRRELSHDYQQKSQTQKKLQEKYESQHLQTVEIVKKCNDLSLMLYSQKQDYTFDISYALEKVTREFNDFNKNRTPYDRIVASLDIEIGRYARLIESLRRLPPVLEDLEVVPDSLAYHNDTLDAHLLQTESLLQRELQEQVEAVLAQNEVQDTTVTENTVAAFILSESGQTDRDTCLFYASEMLKMYAQTREQVMADSTHYREARLHMEESYQYARDYYGILEEKVFVEGQIPWWTVMTHPVEYWNEAWGAMNEKYSFTDLGKAFTSNDVDYTEEEIANNNRLMNSARMYWLVVYILVFFILWGLAALVLMLLYKVVKPFGRLVAKEQRGYLALLLACVLFLVLSYESSGDDIVRKAISIVHSFIWLLMAIHVALLIRMQPEKLKGGIKIYIPTIFTALFVISCRLLFVPNAFLNFFFPPLLMGMALWQLLANLRSYGKADQTDVVIGWGSFGVTVIATIISVVGYIFLALIILVWWYFQLAVILAVISLWSLTLMYKKGRLDKKVAAYSEKISFVSGDDKGKLLFGATWFYDLIREVLIPLLVLSSIPACVHWALNIFEFNDLYISLFEKPFFTQGEFRVSLYSILFLIVMFAIFRYANKAFHTLWQTFAYKRFLRKNNRTAVRANEINLSLGNSLISVFVWFVYADIFILTLNIPTGSLGLIAGGLSAGVGLALKDIINNFIYGIQLMGGRLRVGDMIECDGNLGKVIAINYQSTQVQEMGGPIIAFTNTALFNKNFKNLTRGSAYVYVKVNVGVSYGTDVDKVREILLAASEQLKTKDKFGRDVVDPKWGIKVGVSELGESSVVLSMKQSVLVEERFGFISRAKELIYKTLNESGITIPFNQLDVHLIDNDK